MKFKKYPSLIPVANTYIGEKEAKAAYSVVKSGWLSSGPKVLEFEKLFEKIVKAKHAIAVNNGTAALHVVLAALDIKDGDEVIVPSLTFISSANAVVYQRAIPVLAECDPVTYNITPAEIEKRITSKTKAIISVDMNGMPVDYDAIQALAKKHSLHFISDSAESLGATYKNNPVGSIAPIHVFSFFPNKNATTGEGGMITTENDALASKMRMILNQGQDYRYHHVMLGYNYRLTNVQGAIGTEQLKRLSYVIQEKEKLARIYNKAFKNCKHIHIPYLPAYVTNHAWYMYAISVSEVNRDEIVKQLEKYNVQTRLSFPPIHTQPLYQKMFGYTHASLPISLKAWNSLIDIPIWVGMGRKRQTFVIDLLMNLCEKN